MLVLAVWSGPSPGAGNLDYSAVDRELLAVRIDSAPTDSFLAIRCDSIGRLFVGGRETLYVYEPEKNGGYRQRRPLLAFPKDTWVYDIEILGDDLYVMTVSALYVVPHGVIQREGLHVKRLVWGVPLGHVHQCFHALAWGPEGDLYFSMGDPLWYYGDFTRPDHWGYWTFFSQPEGTKTAYTGVGGVFRCRPDGSHFQVVARGLRNSCGLTFDHNWNLFSNDNDHESMPAEYVPGRIIHVTPHSYFSWPRGWMVFKTPDRADLLETMFNGMGRAVPVLETYYDDTYLPTQYRNNLLISRWGIRAVTRYPLEQRGATFKVSEHMVLAGLNEARPVGVTVGRGGRLFVTIAYMAHNDSSPVYKSDLVMITRKNDSPAHPFHAYDVTSLRPEQLWRELDNPSWESRRRAHLEILRRGEPLLAESVKRMGTTGIEQTALPHLIWLAAASKTPQAAAELIKLSKHVQGSLRLQIIRALTEFHHVSTDPTVIICALGDSDAQVRHAAILACFKMVDQVPQEVLNGTAKSKDTYLRQASALLIAEKASSDTISRLCSEKDSAARLAGVLSAGFRLTIPPATTSLPAELHLDAFPAPSATVIRYADRTIDLAHEARLGMFTVADHWKQGKHSKDQEDLFNLLVKELLDADEQVRLQAAFFLSLLADRRSEPLIIQVHRASEERRLSVASVRGISKAWVVGPFWDGASGLEEIHPPEQGPIDLSAQYPLGATKLFWKEVDFARYCDFSKLYGSCDHASFYAYCRLESSTRQKIQLLVGSDDGVKVWHNGREIWTNKIIRAALPFQDTLLVDLQPGSNDLLFRVQNVTGSCSLYLHYRAKGEVEARLPEKLGLATLSQRLKSAVAANQPIGPEFLQVDWKRAAARGDPKNGRLLFGSLGCIKCHAITADAQVTGGPSLAEALKRFTVPYIVESVLLPSKQVSPVFRSSLIETQGGLVISGLVISETAEKLELLLSDTTHKILFKKEIASRKIVESSPMPQGLVKTPAEMGDLLAYILSNKPKPP